jgi:solute carrier family 27 fatty acid transporter 1/4
VETIISSYCSFKDAVVYGVVVPDTEGKAGMAAISDPDGNLDLEKLATGICKSLPAYARPLFLRVLTEMDVTGNKQYQKVFDFIRAI